MPEMLKGIVLKSTQYRETGLLLTLLTDTHGRINVLARGVKRGKKNSAAYTQQFAYSEFSVFFGRGVPICDSADTEELFYGLRDSVEALCLAQYFASVCMTLPDGTPDTETLRLLLNSLYLTEKRKFPYETIKTVFELKFAQIQGFAPVGNECAECGAPAKKWVFDRGLLCKRCAGDGGFTLSDETLSAIEHILGNEGIKAYRFECNAEERGYLSALTQNYLSYQLDAKFPAADFFAKL